MIIFLQNIFSNKGKCLPTMNFLINGTSHCISIRDTDNSQRWKFCLFGLNCYVHSATQTQNWNASKLVVLVNWCTEHNCNLNMINLVWLLTQKTPQDAFFSVIVMRFLHWFERPLSQLLLQLVGSWSLAHTLINFYDLHWDSNNKDIIQRAKKYKVKPKISLR